MIVHDRVLFGGILTLLGVALIGLLGRLFWPDNPLTIDLGSSLQAPSLQHPMGTDQLGRDVFARWCEGAQISMTVGVVVVVVGGVLGVATGLDLGYLERGR